jgi:hypothetical protein
MLQVVEEKKVFAHNYMGLNPFLLLKGHGTCFELGFLEYTNAADMKWNSCIGLPLEHPTGK